MYMHDAIVPLAVLAMCVELLLICIVESRTDVTVNSRSPRERDTFRRSTAPALGYGRNRKGQASCFPFDGDQPTQQGISHPAQSSSKAQLHIISAASYEETCLMVHSS